MEHERQLFKCFFVLKYVVFRSQIYCMLLMIMEMYDKFIKRPLIYSVFKDEVEKKATLEDKKEDESEGM